MAKYKVAVYGTPGRVITIDTDAGATIGENLRMTDGSLATAAKLREFIGVSGVGSATRHKDLLGLQGGDDHPQYTTWNASERINAPWTFRDNKALGFGDANDLRISHDGTNSIIANDTGDLTVFSAGDLNLSPTGEVDLPADNLELRIGAGQDLRLYHDGTNSIIRNDTGEMRVQMGAAQVVRIVTAGTAHFLATTGQNVAFDNSSANGGYFTFQRSGAPYADFGNAAQVGSGGTLDGLGLGTRSTTPIEFSTNNATRWTILGTSPYHLRGTADNQELQLGASQDLRLYHDGTNSIIINDTGNLRILEGATEVAAFTAARQDMNLPLQLKNYTVATLPTGAQGDTAFVTDALAPAFLTAVVGGGAVVAPVFYDGTNWVAI